MRHEHLQNDSYYPPWLVTGTDTEIGKTWGSVALIHAWRRLGLTVAGMKPVASGCAIRDGKLYNDDALALHEAAGLEVPYDWVNPYAFAPPIAPHLAAAQIGVGIELNVIGTAFAQLQRQADKVIVEGVGGWRVFLNEQQSLRDLARALKAEVVLVVGLRLGCINHALLSAEAIARDGLHLAGWLANPADPEFAAADSVQTLRKHLHAPYFGCLPRLDVLDGARLGAALNLEAVR